MKLSEKEWSVVGRLRRKRMATMKTLRDELGVSHMTVVRALNKYGYLSSVNHNAAYYTLHDIPGFDQDGLWNYRKICFSKYRTLEKTLLALVQNASAGLTVAELEQRLNTKVGNLLSRLCRQNQLTRYFAGRQAVYLAVDSQQQQQQRNQRDLCREESRSAATGTNQPAFPPGCDVILVLEVLIQIIKRPKADAASLAKAVRARGIKINAVQVQRVLDFYALGKKTEHSPWRSWR
jgi:hypothetical protein